MYNEPIFYPVSILKTDTNSNLNSTNCRSSKHICFSSEVNNSNTESSESGSIHRIALSALHCYPQGKNGSFSLNIQLSNVKNIPWWLFVLTLPASTIATPNFTSTAEKALYAMGQLLSKNENQINHHVTRFWEDAFKESKIEEHQAFHKASFNIFLALTQFIEPALAVKKNCRIKISTHLKLSSTHRLFQPIASFLNALQKTICTNQNDCEKWVNECCKHPQIQKMSQEVFQELMDFLTTLPENNLAFRLHETLIRLHTATALISIQFEKFIPPLERNRSSSSSSTAPIQKNKSPSTTPAQPPVINEKVKETQSASDNPSHSKTETIEIAKTDDSKLTEFNAEKWLETFRRLSNSSKSERDLVIGELIKADQDHPEILPSIFSSINVKQAGLLFANPLINDRIVITYTQNLESRTVFLKNFASLVSKNASAQKNRSEYHNMLESILHFYCEFFLIQNHELSTNEINTISHAIQISKERDVAFDISGKLIQILFNKQSSKSEILNMSLNWIVHHGNKKALHIDQAIVLLSLSKEFVILSPNIDLFKLAETLQHIGMTIQGNECYNFLRESTYVIICNLKNLIKNKSQKEENSSKGNSYKERLSENFSLLVKTTEHYISYSCLLEIIHFIALEHISVVDFPEVFKLFQIATETCFSNLTSNEEMDEIYFQQILKEIIAASNKPNTHLVTPLAVRFLTQPLTSQPTLYFFIDSAVTLYNGYHEIFIPVEKQAFIKLLLNELKKCHSIPARIATKIKVTFDLFQSEIKKRLPSDETFKELQEKLFLITTNDKPKDDAISETKFDKEDTI